MIIYVIFGVVALSSWLIQYRLKSKFEKYSKLALGNGMSGKEVAEKMLRDNGISDVTVISTSGHLTDHYDPSAKVLRLSNNVYNGTDVAALGIAAHEVGHAIQHAEGYAPLRFRNAIVPVVNFASQLVWIFVMAGFIFQMSGLITVGIWLFSASVVFSILTLPVEIDASKRAIARLETAGFLNDQELEGAKKVLSAAAWTYIAASFMAIAQLLRLIMIRDRRN